MVPSAFLSPSFYGTIDAAIVHPIRVCEINLCLTKSALREVDSAMQKQFPTLTYLSLSLDCYDRYPGPALSDGFLGGSAPNLRYLKLFKIEFPTLPKLLLSATSPVRLTFSDIPRCGYISPEAMVTGPAALAELKRLTIEFKFPMSCRDLRPPPPTRTILPALTHFVFEGAREYLEDFVSRIDALCFTSPL